MMDDDHDKYGSLPIPTYEEAIASRPSSSQTHTGPEEVSDDAERQGLLGQPAPSGRGRYHAPTVESVRSSMDSDMYLPEVTGAEDEAELVRRDMEEMEFMDADHSPSRLRSGLSKRFSSLTHSLSAIRLPSFRIIPRAWSCPTPSFPEGLAIPLSVIARLFGLAVIGVSVYLLFAFNIIPTRSQAVYQYDPESVRAFVQATAIKRGDHVRDSLHYITSFDHVAGTEGDLFLAKWMHEKWEQAGIDKVVDEEYYVYLNYPTPDGRMVRILDPPEFRKDLALEEDNVFKGTGESQQQTLVWHGSSRSGNVTGHLVYANGGSREDFQKLKDMGINVNGSIALVRYYGTQDDRALKVKAAELAGAVGCLIYSDPKDDGFAQGKVYPDGPWRPADSVQRGSVGLMSWVLGDYLTPGWESNKKAKRISEINNPGLNNIPSLPLSWRDAQALLQAIHGKGSRVPDDWVGSVPDVQQWWTGSNDGPTVWLQNLQDENKQQTIWNVHGTIQGVETPQERVLVGNHRDAWCFGAVDPGSGSAVLMEVVAILGLLVERGWRPLRSIDFFSWDAEEYNMMGSTEFVEGHIELLRTNAVGYLNVDVGVSGSQFRAAASPLLERMVVDVLNRVEDPIKNKTLGVLWNEQNSQIEGLGSGSDYVAFQDLAGVSSLDFGFTGPKHGYPYHSCYDDFEWMEKFGDPTFDYHRSLAQVWALLILEMADRPILPYDISRYAEVVQTYIDKLQHDSASMKVDIEPLRNAANLLVDNAQKFHLFEAHWSREVMARGSMESNALAVERHKFNAKLSNFDKDLLDLPGMFPGDEKEQHGVPGREQFKHIIFGPQAWSRYDEAYFPAVRDALDAGDKEATQHHINKAARIIERAAKRLLE
ncbi:glutamate carboxypeptidase 2 [Myriangium duriaei CBS 260.36]|uniref:Glutamate carboxypeptidase 2 n=1 Tax=Myriangium duriaei CBS 260.36 TaxID=1168546 RepID=A0A9P4J7K5_9PEZI|nr:glutamate carboxypeptidase 2 [Myriangium duriaei CBS 260.36]